MLKDWSLLCALRVCTWINTYFGQSPVSDMWGVGSSAQGVCVASWALSEVAESCPQTRCVGMIVWFEFGVVFGS